MTDKKLLRHLEGKHHDAKPRYSRKAVADMVGSMGSVELFENALDSDLSLAEINELLEQNEQD